MKNREIKFLAVGDIALGDHPLCVGFGAHSTFKDLSVLFPFQHVIDHLKKADILFGNLECPLSEKGLKTGEYRSIQMRGKADYVKGLVEAGFKVLNLANNHSMQHGREAFFETVSLLESNGIRCCGVKSESQLRTKPSILEMNGMKVGVLGYSLRPRQYFTYDPLYAEGTLVGINRDINEVKPKVDTIIVSLHWGEEFVDRPSPEEVQLARKIIDAGADLILGHHPHVLRGIEHYKNGVIVYSLGNFVCDMLWDQRLRESLIFSCLLTKAGLQYVNLTPIFINENYQPKVLMGEEGKRLLARIMDLSSRLTGDDPSGFDARSSEYKKESVDILRVYRSKSHRYFLTHIRKYPLSILFQLIRAYLLRRLPVLHGKDECEYGG